MLNEFSITHIFFNGKKTHNMKNWKCLCYFREILNLKYLIEKLTEILIYFYIINIARSAVEK